MFAGVRDELRQLVDGLDPVALAPTDAVRVLDELVEIKRLVGAAELLVLPRATDSPMWRQAGERSPEHWLAKKGGTTVGYARSALECAERLESLPDTEAALRGGQLSADQAVAIAAAASADPGAESALLARAAHDSVLGLRAECERVRAAALGDEGLEARQHATRGLRHRADPGRGFVLEAQGTPAAGAELLACLAPFERQVFEAARTAGRRESRPAYAFDALLAMAQAAVGAGATTTTKAKVPAKVIARIDHAALVRGHTHPAETSEIAGVGPVPVTTIARMVASGDAFLAAVVTKGVDVLTVAHPGRRPSAVQQSALEWMYPACGGESCTVSHGLEFDHHTDWADTHHTMLSDGAMFCPFEHDKKTYQGWTVAPSPVPGKKRLIPPPGPDPPDDG
ncbi:MAG: protein of unknown function endonuclease [Acidimicrobiales bacterium]|jgi:hypothetical protein|nr:protein of unknown function endonuclease [Acidimicrobiales bacterium]